MRLSLPLLTAWPDADAGGSTPHIPRAEKPFNVGIIHSDVHVIGGVGVGAGLQAPPCRLPHRPHSVVKERVAWPPSRRLGSPRRVQTAQDPGTSLHFYTFTSFDSLIDDFLRTRAPSGRVTRVIRWQTPSRSAEDPLPEGQRPEERAWCLPPGGHEPGSSAGRRRGSPRPEGLLVDPVKEDGLCVSSGEQRENARAKGQKPAPGLREKRRWRHGGGAWEIAGTVHTRASSPESDGGVSGAGCVDARARLQCTLTLAVAGPLEAPSGHRHSPDLDGGAAQDLPVTVPRAVGHRAAARGVVAADLPEARLPPLLEVAVLVLHVLRYKLEFPDAINFDKGEVKLQRDTEGAGAFTGAFAGEARPWPARPQLGHEAKAAARLPARPRRPALSQDSGSSLVGTCRILHLFNKHCFTSHIKIPLR